jgi:hypothetical protein
VQAKTLTIISSENNKMTFLLISIGFISILIILTRGDLKIQLASILLIGLMSCSGYCWYIHALHQKDSKVYFIQKRMGEYQAYSNEELNKALENAKKEDDENETKMNIYGLVFIICVIGLTLGAIRVLGRTKHRQTNN